MGPRLAQCIIYPDDSRLLGSAKGWATLPFMSLMADFTSGIFAPLSPRCFRGALDMVGGEVWCTGMARVGGLLVYKVRLDVL